MANVFKKERTINISACFSVTLPISMFAFKRGWIFIVLVFFLGCASTKPIAQTIASGSAVAVWDLENFTIDTDSAPAMSDIGELLSARIIETVSAVGTVVERQQLLLALEELNIGTTGLIDDTKRLSVGKIVGARFMVLGGYMVVNQSFRLDLRLVEVETGKILKTAQKTVESEDVAIWLDAASSAAADLVP